MPGFTCIPLYGWPELFDQDVIDDDALLSLVGWLPQGYPPAYCFRWRIASAITSEPDDLPRKGIPCHHAHRRDVAHRARTLWLGNALQVISKPSVR